MIEQTMKSTFAVVLNLPYALIALFGAAISLPYEITVKRSRCALIIYVRSLWWKKPGVRAATLGLVVLAREPLAPGDIEHELIHVEQYIREPFVHPFLYLYQSFMHGYRNNPYEREAYRRAGNPYINADGKKEYIK